MKTELNYKEVSFICNQSEDWAISIIAKHYDMDIHNIRQSQTKAQFKDWLNEFYGEYKISANQLSILTGLNISRLMEDVNNNFLKNKQCMEYLEKKVREKMKPNKQGFLPLSISIPPEVTAFMSPNTIDTTIEWLNIAFTDKIIYKVKAA